MFGSKFSVMPRPSGPGERALDARVAEALRATLGAAAAASLAVPHTHAHTHTEPSALSGSPSVSDVASASESPAASGGNKPDQPPEGAAGVVDSDTALFARITPSGSLTHTVTEYLRGSISSYGRLPAVALRRSVGESITRQHQRAVEALASSAPTAAAGDAGALPAHTSTHTDAHTDAEGGSAGASPLMQVSNELSAVAGGADGADGQGDHVAAAAGAKRARNDAEAPANGHAHTHTEKKARRADGLRAAKRASMGGRAQPVPGPRPGGAPGQTPDGPPGGTFLLPPYVRPTERYSDVGGVSAVLRDIREVIEYPLTHPEIYTHLGVAPPRGVLLHGPPGVGKTLLARAIAGELGVHFRSIVGPEVVGAVSGESETRLRAVFDDAVANAPAIVFIDEIDAIAPRRDSSSRGMEKRVVAQLFACMDALGHAVPRDEDDAGVSVPPPAVVVIAATSRPEGIDTGLRRSGRFDREIAVPIPDEPARFDILRVLVSKMRLAAEGDAFDLRSIARATPGYVGSDLAALTKEAAVCAVNRSFDSLFGKPMEPVAHKPGTPAAVMEEHRIRELLRATPVLSPERMEGLHVTYDDFHNALSRVQPSALREGFATIPDVTWGDVGALSEVRSELEMAIVQPLRRPELFASVGLSVPAGVLLYGPPGCGKTLLAKAIANETSANFISVKGPELLDKYVGESERAVRQVFSRARSSAPCIIFFDELDALAPRRGGPGSGNGNVTERVVNQLLTELDGLETRRDVFVLGATNRPDIIDPAMLRPGRLDKLLYVPLPKAPDRADILAKQLRKTPVAANVSIAALAADGRTEGFSGADLAGLVREASVAALSDYLARGAPAGEHVQVESKHFDEAFTKTAPSVTRADEKVYNALQHKLRRVRGHITAQPEGGATPQAGAAPELAS